MNLSLKHGFQATVGTPATRTHKMAAILLAAGAGRRFGSDKLLNTSLNDTPLGLIAAETFKRVLPLYIVVRTGNDALRKVYEAAGYEVIVADQAEKGMGNSLSAGLQRVTMTDTTACLVGLADMPLVEKNTLRLLCSRLEEGSEIVRPIYKGQAGQPVGFVRRHFENLIGLSEDKGARDYLKQHENLVNYVPVNDVGTITDIDTPEDLAKVSINNRKSN